MCRGGCSNIKKCDHEGINMSTNGESNLDSRRLDGGAYSRSKKSSISILAPGTCSSASNDVIKGVEKHDLWTTKGSSWRQRQGLRANPFSPRVSPIDASTSRTTAASTLASAQPTRPIQDMLACIDENEGLKAARGKNLQTRGDTMVTRPKSSSSRTSAAKTPTRGHVRPHTVGSGLRALGLPWVDVPERRTQRAKFDGSFSSPPRRDSVDASGNAATPTAAVPPQDARLHATRSVEVGARNSEGGGISTGQKYLHGGSPPRRDKGSTGAPTMAKTTVGLTAQALGSPGIALDRLGRATVIKKVRRSSLSDRRGFERLLRLCV